MKESVVENLKKKYKGITAGTLKTAKLITIMIMFMSVILFSSEEAYAKTTKITMGKGQKVETGINIADSLWKSTNKKVAVVKNGKITALRNGKTTISAKYKNKSYKFQVTVSKVYLTKQNVTVNRGKSTTIRLKGISSKKVKWSTSNKSVATVKNGKITGRKRGTAAISARANGVKYTCKVKVETPKINKTKLTMTKSKSYQLKMSGTGSSISWSTSNKKTATVSSKGKLTAKKKGIATITAKVNGTKYTCKVTVEDPKLNKTEAGLKKNETVSLKLNNTSRSVSWSSSNKGVATVDKKGKVKGVSNGNAVITAKISDASFKCNVTVSTSGKVEPDEPDEPTEKFSASLDKTSITVAENQKTFTLTATVKGAEKSGYEIEWKTWDSAIATLKSVSGNTATFEKNHFGDTKAAAVVKDKQTGEKITLNCEVKCYDIIESSYEIDEGATEDLGDGCTSIVSSNPKIVSVSGNKITAHDLGSVVITGYNAYNGYCTIKMNVTVKGEYLKTKGTYNEALTNSVYKELYSDGFTRNETYFPDPKQIPFLLATADRWYNGEITTYRAEYLMETTPFETVVDSLGHYYGISDFGKGICEITINNASSVDSIVNGINSFMRGENWNEGDWDWAKLLLYVKVNVDNVNNKAYVYIIP